MVAMVSCCYTQHDHCVDNVIVQDRIVLWRTTAEYITSSMTTPIDAAILTPIPNTSGRPMARMPNMNSQSTTALPAMAWYYPTIGPLAAKFKKPNIGEPPSIHPLPDSVANPSPNNLSTKAHRKIQPKLNLSRAQMYAVPSDLPTVFIHVSHRFLGEGTLIQAGLGSGVWRSYSNHRLYSFAVESRLHCVPHIH